VTIGKNNSNEAGRSGYDNLPFVFFSVIQSSDWWVDMVPMFMCVLTCLGFLLTRGRDPPPS
jgi:hypothetical protein